MQIHTPGLQNLLRGGQITLINVLPPAQFSQKHIPQSKNVPLDDKEFPARVEQASGGKDQPVVVYCSCTESSASTQAAETLEQKGFEEVYEYVGGMKAWEEASLPVEPKD